MKGKILWKVILIVALLSIPVIFGLLVPVQGIEVLNWFGVMLIYAVLLTIPLLIWLFIILFKRWKRKALILKVLILVIAVPVIFCGIMFGTCMTVGAGASLREVFFK